jgi:hypothetical protein
MAGMPCIDRYPEVFFPRAGRVREPAPVIVPPRRPRELELQARWFAGEFGRQFIADNGSTVEVVQFGVWNREAGPDFSDAAVSLNGAEPVRGCIELHQDVRDWERHGHAVNPAYENVVLHVFFAENGPAFFTRTAANRLVPQARLPWVEGGPATGPGCGAPIAKTGGCAVPLRDLPEEKVRGIVRAAARHRLAKKGARLARLAEIHGPDEALFQALAATLGYKVNKLPFTLIAQRAPLRTLLQNKEEIAPVLFGVSGFLHRPDFSSCDFETRRWLRGLWDRWWSRRAEFERLAIAPGEWRLAGQRPANHPQRRIAALAQIARNWAKIRALARRCDPAAIRDFFTALSDGYWDHHYTLQSARCANRMALVGKTRAIEMLANVFFPLALLSNPARWTDYERLPAALGNRRAGIAALRLFGGNPLGTGFLKTLAGQQGLLQIDEDFCMDDASGCANCLFPRQLGQW